MVYAIDQDSFERHLSTLQENSSKKLMDYFMKYWEPIKCEWVRGLQKGFLNFHQSVNNRCESFNKHVKTCVKSYSSMTQFITNLMVVIQHYQLQRDHRAVKLVTKTSTEVVKDVTVATYRKYLTPYACERVEDQLKLREKVEIVEVDQPEQYIVRVNCYSYENLSVSSTECSCRFRTGMSLPCRHIFHVRESFEIPLFSEDLCNPRWTLNYYIDHQRLLSTTGANELQGTSSQNITDNVEINEDEFLEDIRDKTNVICLPKEVILSETDKFSKAKKKAFEICTSMSLCGTAEFNTMYARLVEFCKYGFESDFQIVCSKKTLDKSKFNTRKELEMNSDGNNIMKTKMPDTVRKRGNTSGYGKTILKTNVIGTNKRKKLSKEIDVLPKKKKSPIEQNHEQK